MFYVHLSAVSIDSRHFGSHSELITLIDGLSAGNSLIRRRSSCPSTDCSRLYPFGSLGGLDFRKVSIFIVSIIVFGLHKMSARIIPKAKISSFFKLSNYAVVC